MSDLLENLLESKRITKSQYDIYLMFCIDERGRVLLKHWVYDCLYQTTKRGHGADYAFMDGRRSFVCEIHETVEHVQKLINNGGKGATSEDHVESLKSEVSRLEKMIQEKIK